MGGLTTRYVYAGQRVIEEHSGGSIKATYVYGNYLDEVLQMRRDVDANGSMEGYWYHTDDMFNVVAVTDADGAVVERYEYGDYGAPEVYDAAWTPRTATAIGNPYLFTGRPYDSCARYTFTSRMRSFHASWPQPFCSASVM